MAKSSIPGGQSASAPAPIQAKAKAKSRAPGKAKGRNGGTLKPGDGTGTGNAVRGERATVAAPSDISTDPIGHAKTLRNDRNDKVNTAKFVIVVGASAGGLKALSEFVAQLKTAMDAAVFIVMHLSRTGISDFLMLQLQKFTPLPCEIATEGACIEKGHIYIAAPNLHLLVKKGRIILGRGPEENRWRPSIDVLFRSAAAAYSTRVIGVVLTGLLDDGTTGMLAIQRSGGTCIVQDPNEAEYPDMPLSVLSNMQADYCISLADMGEVISGITRSTPEEKPAPEDIIIESQIAERVVVDYDNVKQLGEKSIYACPDCGGGLWDINRAEGGHGKMVRYRCHIGHSYSEKDLVIKQAEVFESTLWTALRIMEERKTLLNKMESDNTARGFSKFAEGYKDKADAMQVHIDKMKEVLFASQKSA